MEVSICKQRITILFSTRFQGNELLRLQRIHGPAKGYAHKSRSRPSRQQQQQSAQLLPNSYLGRWLRRRELAPIPHAHKNWLAPPQPGDDEGCDTFVSRLSWDAALRAAAVVTAAVDRVVLGNCKAGSIGGVTGSQGGATAAATAAPTVTDRKSVV